MLAPHAQSLSLIPSPAYARHSGTDLQFQHLGGTGRIRTFRSSLAVQEVHSSWKGGIVGGSLGPGARQTLVYWFFDKILPLRVLLSSFAK